MQYVGYQGNGDTEQQSHLNFLPNCLGAIHALCVSVSVVCLVVHKSTGSSPIAILQENDKATKFYTGLESWKLFQHILNFLVKSCLSLATPSTNMLPLVFLISVDVFEAQSASSRFVLSLWPNCS